MIRKLFIALVLFSVSFASMPMRPPVMAQQGSTVQALTHYALTVYSGPNRSNAIIGVLNPHAKVILESRNADLSWVLARSLDGLLRGWVEPRYLTLSDDANIAKLFVSTEIMFFPTTHSAYDTIDLTAYPIVPDDLGRARDIYERGLVHGADSHTISKVGDCISDNVSFLSPFGRGQYALGNYVGLQAVVDHYAASLAQDSLAAYDGLVTTAVLDPVFSNPLACLPGETPLRCEYRVRESSVAIIMFGAQDLLFTNINDFDRNLRRVVHETIEAGVIPILSTFPGNTQLWDQSLLYNQAVVQIALDYEIPLMNLWLALEQLPNHGLGSDGRHLSAAITSPGDLSTDRNLQRGYPLRNLVTLQALDVVWRGVTSVD
ncbi:MAG: hypothetical protein JXA10_14135 [Anaerolineae bacterium]|nr:hypothetical protein [Anaerolineae bacterium]